MSADEIASRISELILGESPVIQRIREVILRAAPTSLPVLIEGPTGSGKELVARALHIASGRQGRFVAFNVCAVSEGMFEDALFGHVKGAFTGAASDHSGYLLEAHKGTLLLDEISTLRPASQAKLLRALETKCFRPMGASEDLQSDFRILAATNERLERLEHNGRFREDLRHRLSGVVIRMPSLAERKEDIPALAEHFLSEVQVGKSLRVTQAGLRILQQEAWPGNVRELRTTLHRAAALFCTGTSLGSGEIEAALEPLVALGSGGTQRAGPKRLLHTLERCDWDTAEAAARLGIHRSTVYRRMERFGISRPESYGGNGEAEEPQEAG